MLANTTKELVGHPRCVLSCWQICSNNYHEITTHCITKQNCNLCDAVSFHYNQTYFIHVVQAYKRK